MKIQLNMRKWFPVYCAVGLIFMLPFLCFGAEGGVQIPILGGGGVRAGEADSSDASDCPLVNYTVLFVDNSDYSRKVFNTQSGFAAEGTLLTIHFPEQIVGNDGYLWKSAEASPMTAAVYGAGTHKYYVGYERGGRIQVPEDPEKEAKEELDKWIQTALKADCEITGHTPSGLPDPYLVVTNTESSNSRIKNLVSMIDDAKWHYFYMLGRNYKPQPQLIGTWFHAQYSAVTESQFNIGKDAYTVIKVGVMRMWEAESCAHKWDSVSSVINTCIVNGQETYQCKKCGVDTAVLLPALGHLDKDNDSLCDSCGKRAFAQRKGDTIDSVLHTAGEDIPLSFTCLDEDYNGTGKMLYLADSVLGSNVTGLCFESDSSYRDSAIRRYFEFGFANQSSLAAALLANEWGGEGLRDYAGLLSKPEWELYAKRGSITAAKQGHFLRTSDGENRVYAVHPDGSVTAAAAAGNTEFGARPCILLDKPETEDIAEPYQWKTGDVQARRIGTETYLFRCVDEDYSGNQSTHRRAALFLCEEVIRADVGSDGHTLKKFSFGRDNNYKTSVVRAWLNDNAADTSFGTEPIYIGVNTAYTGSTGEHSFEQIGESRLSAHDIGFQLLQDQLFCLSVEEAIKYKDSLWKFNGSEENNHRTQLSPYSSGYYLRTPFYAADGTGKFRYSEDVYMVDLEQGNIHAAKTDGTTVGIRPAFALPQEGHKD